MSKHTPGSWIITEKPQPDGTGSFFIQDNKSKSGWIAEAKGTHVGPKTLAEARSNAFLIAAAPELLDALKKCVARLKDDEPDFGKEGDAIYAAELVIAKAEGRNGQM